MGRDRISLPMYYLPASFVAAVASECSNARDQGIACLLQEASAGQPNQQDQRRLPEEGLPFLTPSLPPLFWGVTGGGRGVCGGVRSANQLKFMR
jgi:hypothetical protein